MSTGPARSTKMRAVDLYKGVTLRTYSQPAKPARIVHNRISHKRRHKMLNIAVSLMGAAGSEWAGGPAAPPDRPVPGESNVECTLHSFRISSIQVIVERPRGRDLITFNYSYPSAPASYAAAPYR